MLPTSLSMETISRGLFLQELNQDVVASNIANTYQDSQGYLVNSLQRVNSTDGLSLFTGNSLGQNAVGTGPLVSQITRLRNMFLDTQIQQVSSTVGKSEILTGVLSQINGVINGATGTLDAALNKFALDWKNLGANANPSTDVVDRAAVVNDGVAFATLANTQYTQLENLQMGYNGQINQTVSDINQLLQQLSSLNKQLLASPAGVNVNSLLDARDYALDKLSRLVNIQTNIGTAGTVNVYLGGSTLTLVDGAGASILQTNVMNVHNPGLVNVTIQSAEGTVTIPDATPWITGGNLSGELQARDVMLEGYKDQIDQIASSVISATNMLHEAGYDSTGTVTGNDFFTGTGAVNISVNGSIVADKTYGLVAASLVPSTDPNYLVDNGLVAKYLGNLPSVMANNFVASGNNINFGGNIDPTQPMNTQPFAVGPNAGSFTVNGNTVSYVPTDSIDDVLARINQMAPNVYAVFNAKLQEFYMVSNNPISIVDQPPGAGSFTFFGSITNYLTSTITMNNDFTGTNPLFDQNAPLNSIVPGPAFNTGPNSQAFRVTPGTGGVFSINGVTFPAWNDTMSLSGISFLIGPLLPGTGLGFGITTPPGPYAGGTYAPGFGPETVFLASSSAPIPLQIVDIKGNFTDFTGLNATNTPIGSLTSGVLGQITSDLSSQQAIQGQAQASLDQLNNAQADVAGLDTSTDGTGHGVPLATLQQQAVQSLVAYNASLDMMQVIDQMYEDLVGIVGGTTTSNNFFQHH